MDGRFKLTRKQRKNLKEHELKPFLVDHEIVRLQKEENKFGARSKKSSRCLTRWWVVAQAVGDLQEEKRHHN